MTIGFEESNATSTRAQSNATRAHCHTDGELFKRLRGGVRVNWCQRKILLQVYASLYDDCFVDVRLYSNSSSNFSVNLMVKENELFSCSLCSRFPHNNTVIKIIRIPYMNTRTQSHTVV